MSDRGVYARISFNAVVGPTISGDPDYMMAYGGRWQRVNAEYMATESVIGGYLVRFSLWWRQATCPPEAWYCYYIDFPGLEFTGDSSLIFHTIRLTPVEDYDVAGAVDQLFNATKEPTPSNVGIGWEFNVNGNEEGWEAWNDLAPLNVANGVLRTQSTGNDPYIASPNFSLNAAEYPILEIKMKLTSPRQQHGGFRDIRTQFFFITTSDWYYDGKKSVWVPDILPWALFKVYRIDLSENQFWKGTITQIRLDPLAEEGGIEIDYIRLLDTTVLPTRTPSN